MIMMAVGHVRHRPHPVVRHDRHLGADPAAALPPGAGLLHRRRVRRRHDVHRRVLARPAPRVLRQLARVRHVHRLRARRGPRHGHAARPRRGRRCSWGWRIPFFIAGPLGVVGLYLRMKLEETPAFPDAAVEATERERQQGAVPRAVADHWRALLVCMGLVLAFNVTNYMLRLHADLPDRDALGYDDSTSVAAARCIVVMVLMVIVHPFLGRLTDRVGRRPVSSPAARACSCCRSRRSC